MKCVGGPYPAAANFPATSSPIRSESPASTRAMMQPPKPPPVIRAPRAPAASRSLDRQIDLRHRDLEVVPHGLVGGVEEWREVSDPARPQNFGGLPAPGRSR